MLNYKKPEHPPDIYFIRRNQELLNKFMDDREMNKLIKEANPRYRDNYKLFSLDPLEKKIVFIWGKDRLWVCRFRRGRRPLIRLAGFLSDLTQKSFGPRLGPTLGLWIPWGVEAWESGLVRGPSSADPQEHRGPPQLEWALWSLVVKIHSYGFKYYKLPKGFWSNSASWMNMWICKRNP